MKNQEAKMTLRMDKKLYAQLLKYSNSADLSMAQMARKAIQKFIDEQYETTRPKN
jgi:predicted HicB family RNase H-like nuclease